MYVIYGSTITHPTPPPPSGAGMETLKTENGQFTRRKTWVQVIWKARGSIIGKNSCQTSKSLLPASHVKSSEPASKTTFLYKNVFSVAKKSQQKYQDGVERDVLRLWIKLEPRKDETTQSLLYRPSRSETS